MGTGDRAERRAQKYFESKALKRHNRTPFPAAQGQDASATEADKSKESPQNAEKELDLFCAESFPTIMVNTLKHGFVFTSFDAHPDVANAKSTIVAKWDREVVSSLKWILQLDNKQNHRAGARLERYFINIFRVSLGEKKKRAERFPASDDKVMIFSDWMDFINAASRSLRGEPVNAGGLGWATPYAMPSAELCKVIDEIAWYRHLFRNIRGPVNKKEGTKKQNELLDAVDAWIDSFPEGKFSLFDLGVNSVGDDKPKQLSVRPREG